MTKEDYINYYTYVMWDAPEKKKSHINYYLRQLLVNGAIIILLFYTDLFQSQKTYFYLYIGVLVLVIAVQVFSVRNRVKRQAEKITEDINNSSFFDEVEIQVSETGLTSKDQLKECKYSWAAFIKKQEDAQYYFLFTSSVQAIIIPKRALTSAEEKTQFDKLLSRHLSFDAEVGHLIKG